MKPLFRIHLIAMLAATTLAPVMHAQTAEPVKPEPPPATTADPGAIESSINNRGPLHSPLGFEARVAPRSKDDNESEGGMTTFLSKSGTQLGGIDLATPVMFSPDGRILLLRDAGPEDDCRLFFMDVAAGDPPPLWSNRHRIGSRWVEKVAWSKDGKTLVLINNPALSDTPSETIIVADHLGKNRKAEPTAPDLRVRQVEHEVLLRKYRSAMEELNKAEQAVAADTDQKQASQTLEARRRWLDALKANLAKLDGKDAPSPDSQVATNTKEKVVSVAASGRFKVVQEYLGFDEARSRSEIRESIRFSDEAFPTVILGGSFSWTGNYSISPDEQWLLRIQKTGSGSSMAILYSVQENGRVFEVTGFDDLLWTAADRSSRIIKDLLHNTSVESATWSNDNESIEIDMYGEYAPQVNSEFIPIRHLIAYDLKTHRPVIKTLGGQPADSGDESRRNADAKPMAPDQVTSVRSSTAGEDSVLLNTGGGTEDDPIPSSIRLCSGFGGYGLLLCASDDRSWINIKHGNTIVDLQAATHALRDGSFPNKADDAVEWRGIVKNGKFIPFALIYRMEYNMDETGAKRESRLIIIHLAGEKSSVVGYAQGADEDAKARAMADEYRPK